MAKGRRDSQNVASVADYDTEAEEEVHESRKLANSGAKRSSGISDAPLLHTDLASDSGYSSKTQATSASADSAASIKERAAISLASTQDVATSGVLVRRRVVDGDTGSQRSGSSTSTKTKKKVVVKCKDPNCAECIKAREKAARKHKPRVTISTEASPESTPRDRSPGKSSSTATVRPKPAIIQSAQPHRRDSQQGASRPTSMYEMQEAMMRPGGGYFSHQGHPTGYQQPGTPLTMVGRSNAAMVAARGGAIPSARYAPVAYDPQAGQRVSARKVMQPTVVQVDVDEDRRRKLAAARAKQARQTQALEDSEEDESESEEEEEYSEDEEEENAAEFMRRMKGQSAQPGAKSTMAQMHAKLAAAKARQQELEMQKQRIQMEQARRTAMPPPPVPPPPPASALPPPPPVSAFVGHTQAGQALPSMRRAQQAQISYPERRPSQLDEYSEDLRASIRALTPGQSGSSMQRRPSLASSGGTKATSYSQPEFNRSIADPSRNRRLSYIGGERRDSLEHRHADFERSQLQRLITDAVTAQLADMDLLPTQKAKVGFAMDDKLKHAMAYQTHTDRTAPQRPSFGDSLGELPSIPLTAGALRRRDGLPSHASSGTKRSSEEEASRISIGHRLTAGTESVLDGGEMRLRLDTSRFMEIDVDGRTVILNPLDGNKAELIISDKRETTYLSTKGSTATRSVLNRAPSQRERRGTMTERDSRTEYDRDSERTERKTVYKDQDRRREYREERRERDEIRRDRNSPRREDRRRNEEHRDERRINEHRRNTSSRKRRDDDYTSDSESEMSSDDDRRTQRTAVRRGQGDSYESEYTRTGKLKSSKKSYREDEQRGYERPPAARYTASGYPAGSVVFGG